MQLKQMSVGEFLALARLRLSKGRTKFTIYAPPRLLPPFEVYKKTVVEDDVVGVRYIIYCKPNPTDGGWLIKVEVVQEPFNGIPIREALKQAK